jgi:general stress protein YciG
MSDAGKGGGKGRGRGFASMDPEKRRLIAAKGGRAVRPESRSFSKDKSLASRAGKKGGQNVSPEKRSFALDKALAVRAGRMARKKKADGSP